MKIAKYLWFLSLIAFLGIHLATYYFCPQDIVMAVDKNGIPEYLLSKEKYFYSFLALCVIINAIVIIMGNLVSALPKNLLPIPNKDNWFADMVTRRKMASLVKDWFKGFGFLSNLLLIYWVSIVLNGNAEDFKLELDYLLYMACAIFPIWIFAIRFRLSVISNS